MKRAEKKEKILKLKTKAEKLVRANKWKKALSVFVELSELDPKNDRFLRRVGDAYLKTGDATNAKVSYKYLASLYARNGFWAKAISVNKLILELDPEDTEIQESIVELYSHMGIAPVAKDGPAEAANEAPPLELAGDNGQRGSDYSAQTMDQYMVCVDLSESEPVQEQAPAPAPAPAAEPPSPPSEPAPKASDVDDDPMRFFTNQPKALEMDDVVDLSDEVVELEDVVVPVQTVKVPLFSDLIPAEFTDLLQKISVRRLPANKVICKEGQRGDSIYIIVSGSVEVSVAGENGERCVVAHLRSGEFFGEFGLLSDGKRHATVKTESSIEMLELTKSDLREIASEHPRVLKVLDQYYKTRIVDTVLKQNELFSTLEADERKRFIDRFQMVKVPANSYVFKEGDDGGEVYFVKSGQFEVSLTRDNDVIAIAQLGPGDFFGEIALITGKPRTATIRSVVAGELLFLSKENGLEVLNSSSQIKNKLQDVVAQRAEDAVAAYRSHQELKQHLSLV